MLLGSHDRLRPAEEGEDVSFLILVEMNTNIGIHEKSGTHQVLAQENRWLYLGDPSLFCTSVFLSKETS